MSNHLRQLQISITIYLFVLSEILEESNLKLHEQRKNVTNQITINSS